MSILLSSSIMHRISQMYKYSIIPSINQSPTYTSKRRENRNLHFPPFYCCCGLLTLFFYLFNKSHTYRNHTHRNHMPKPHTHPGQGILPTRSNHTPPHCLLAKEKQQRTKRREKMKREKGFKENKFKRKELKHS